MNEWMIDEIMTEGIFIDQQKHVEHIWGSAMTTGGIDKLGWRKSLGSQKAKSLMDTHRYPYTVPSAWL